MTLTAARVAHWVFGAGAALRVLSEGEWPVVAVVFGSTHLALLRDHSGSIALSLPDTWVGAAYTEGELPALRLAFDVALASFRTRHGECVTMADAIVVLAPLLEHATSQGAEVSFPGTPVPSEAWLRAGEATVGVFQEDASVKVVVWVLGEMQALDLERPAQLAELPAWAVNAISEQLQQGAAAPPLPPPSGPVPTLADVLRVLATGQRLQIGGGRYFHTYFIENGQLFDAIFDEGETFTEPTSEALLATSLSRYGEDFQREIARKPRD